MSGFIGGLVALLILILSLAEHFFKAVGDISEEFGESAAPALLEGIAVVEHLGGKLSHFFNVRFGKPHALHIIVDLRYTGFLCANDTVALAYAAVIVLLNAVHL